MKLFFKFFVILFFISSVPAVYAQNSLNQTVSNLSGDAANAYLGPAVSGFGADINSNWFHEIVQPKALSLDIELSFVGMGTFFNNNNKTFSSTGQFRFDLSQATALTAGVGKAYQQGVINEIIDQSFQVGISGPTIVGSKNQNVNITFPGYTFTYNNAKVIIPQQTIALSVDGYLNNLSILPVAVPQLSVGTLLGTSLTLRYLPNTKLNSNLDNINYFGVGIQHNPALWLGIPMPVDLSIGLVGQSLNVGSILKATGESASLNVGKTFGFDIFSVAPYASIAVQKSTIKVNYSVTYNSYINSNYTYETDNISFNENGANTVSFTLGTNLRLGPVNLNVDYSFSQFNTLSAGLGFIIF
jgi:hypothetical protein